MEDYSENITLVIDYVIKNEPIPTTPTPTIIRPSIPDIIRTPIPIKSMPIHINMPIPIPKVNFEKWDSAMQTDTVEKGEFGIQTDEIVEQVVERNDSEMQTDEIYVVVVERNDSGIQTDEISVVVVERNDSEMQTDEIIEQVERNDSGIQTDMIEEIIVEKEIIEKTDSGIQTEEIIVEKEIIEKTDSGIQTEEIIVEKEIIEKTDSEIQTDIIFNHNIETQTENMSSDIPEVIKQLLPEILVENLSSDILLKISKVLSNKNEDVENKKKEIIEKENDIYLRELKITEIQDSLREKYSYIPPPIIQTNQIPKLIFVVPYRDREQQYRFFHKQMTQEILVDYPLGSYKIWYIHQCDSRDFNRGAMKNIGFLVAKQLYPYDYKNITLVFNDVDTMPFSKNFIHYETSSGIVKHFYGYEFALGGIVSMNAYDFERINGYPNLWGWGFEDNCLQVRVKKVDYLRIDRGNFYPILDKNILQLTDGVTRIVNRNEFDQYYHNTTEGIYSITDLNYDIDEVTGFVNIRNFNTGREQDLEKRKIHDLRNGPAPFNPNDKQPPKNRKRMMNLLF
jgi:hypothetical protein